MLLGLEKIIAPEKHAECAEKIRSNFDTLLKVCKEEFSNWNGDRDRQGENIAPVLLSEAAQLATEGSNKHFKKEGVSFTAAKRRNDGKRVLKLCKKRSR